jgi:hypothetical protein
MRFSIDLATAELAVHEANVFGFGPFAAAADEILAVQGDRLCAFETTTGAERWSVGPTPPMRYGRYSLPVPVQTGLLLASGSGLYGYRWS